MSIRRVVLARVVACAFALALASQAAADIAAFNAAVKANDYAKAAAEAAATWPTLDKSRSDIGEIAREFGFAALAAKDYSAAQSYASFAAEHESGDSRLVAVVLQRLAEHNAEPMGQTRSNLLDALTARAALPGLDAISLAAANTLISASLNAKHWTDLRRSADVAAKMAEEGGPALQSELRRFQLFSKVAAYFEQERMEDYIPIRDHKTLIGQDIESAASEETAKRLVPVYWQTSVWGSFIAVHLSENRKWRDKTGKEGAITLTAEAFPRLARLTGLEPTECKLKPARQPLNGSASRTRSHIGAVVLQFDTDNRGRANNPRVLAAVPEDSPVIQLYLKSVDDWTFRPGRPWDRETCSLARSNHTITLTFADYR